MCGLRPPFRGHSGDKLLMLLFACTGGAILGALSVIGLAWTLELVLSELIPAWARTVGVWLGMGVGGSWMGQKAYIELFRAPE